MTDLVAKILAELRAHPTEEEGFSKEDFDQLREPERRLLVDPFVADLANGDSTAVKPLQWLLHERYVPELEARLAILPAGAPGLVFLPYFLYDATGERAYLHRMMVEILRADPAWDRRTSAVGAYLRRAIGGDPLFWDFCRYLILHDPDPAMKKTALIWLAHEKKYPLIELTLDARLTQCLAGMSGPDAPTPDALAILDRLHADTGTFKP